LKKFASVLILLAALSAPLAAQSESRAAGAYVPVTAFDPARDAAADIDAAVAEARRTGKRVLVDVGGDWCIWCKRLDRFFEEHKDVAAYMHRNYVTVRVNYSKENRNEAVLSRYPKVAGYPHLFVLDTTGVLLRSQDTGALERGKGHDWEKVLAFLKAWAPGGNARKSQGNQELR
jgi:thiol:disulfide interchange protein